MGVHGLWKLLEPAGKVVSLESLQNKILGVDVSIWLHQAMKGFQDRKGSPLPNAHLLGIFHRVCKLLFYRIKPVFVFDGGVPVLKKNTIANRKKLKGQASRDAKQVAEQLLKNLIKHKAVRKVLGEKAGRNAVSEEQPRKDENLFDLPPMLNNLDDYQSLSSDSEASVKYEPSGRESDSDQDVKYLSPSKISAMNLDLHTLDVTSENFRSLPADVRHDILSDLKETRKQSSWGRIHEMPKESTDFSSFQLNRLLKRRTVQVSLEEAEKEMGGKVLSMAELEDLMSAQGVKLEDGSACSKESQLNAYSKRIASDVATRFLLVSESAKTKESTGKDTSEASGEIKKDEVKEKFGGEIKIKQEYQDDWSSDGGSEVTEEATFVNSFPKIKLEYPSENEEVLPRETVTIDIGDNDEDVNIVTEYETEQIAGQFAEGKDSLSQAEILALIQNEQMHAAVNKEPLDVPSTSKAFSSQPSTSKSNFTEPSISKVDFAKPSSSETDYSQPSTSKANLSKPNTSKDNLSSRSTINNDGSSWITETTISRRNRKEVVSPSTVKSDSDNDFDEVLPNEPEITKTNVPVEPSRTGGVSLGQNNIEVVIDRNQSYRPEDDIFADIFPVGVTPNETLQATPEKVITIKPQSSTKKSITVDLENEKDKTPVKTPSKFGENINEGVQNVQSTPPLPNTADSVENSVDATSETSKMEDEEKDIAEVQDISYSDKEIRVEKPSKQIIKPPSMSAEELKSLQSELEEEHEELLAEKGRQERLAASITDQMCAEAQELLRLFGVPYVVAPMEAEAQCAFLDALSLTEGTITDDSDIWLFGGRKVYKNFFNQKKHVLQYTSSTIQHYLKLERYHMILLALLVGSDYTTGLQGVGPVTAMEVLAAFPPGKQENLSENRDAMLEGLRRFRDWWQAGQPLRSPAIQQLRNKVKEVQFYEGFPSLAVVDAYLRPAVDESREAFSWGNMDLEGLRDFARMKFGWAQAKADEILLPVAKRVAERKSQRFIDSYFNLMPKYNEGEKKMSKRVKKAVRRMENENSDDNSEDADDPGVRKPTSRKRTAAQGNGSKKKRTQQTNEAVPGEENGQVQRATKPKRPSSVGSRKTGVKRAKEIEEEKAEVSDGNASSEPKKSKTTRSVIEAKHQNDENINKRNVSKTSDELPKPRLRQRTSTGVIRTGATGSKKKTISSDNEEPTEIKENSGKGTVKKRVNQHRKESEKESESHSSRNTISEEESYETIPKEMSHPTSTAPEPTPGTSKDTDPLPNNDLEPEDEEEAILAALHAMDWDDDPWGGFEAPREKMYFGGVRKNPTKPRRTVQPQPTPPPIPTQPIDTRGYRPGARTLERIESRVTHPQLELNFPASRIPQREKDRQQAEESKLKAIKLFKTAGAIKTSKLLGKDPASVKRKPKKKKPTAKVRELDLSEESSSD